MCFSWLSTSLGLSPSYTAIKKNDDFSSHSIRKWEENYPIPADSKINTWDSQKITEFATNIINNLPIQDIADPHIDEVKTHLVQLATTRSRFRNSLLKQMRNNKNIDNDLRSKLVIAVIDSCPTKI